MEMFVAIGIGLGLASVAGIRAFLPLALASLFAFFGLFANFEFASTYLRAEEGILLAALGTLAVLELVLDKVRAVERVFNYIMVPVRAVSGALLFVSAMGLFEESGPVPGLVAGAVISGAVAVLKVLLRPSAMTPSTGVSSSFLSAFEDVVALVGGVIGLFVPYVPVLLVAFLLFFFNRIRKRRGRKFGGLRILGD